MTSDEPLPDRCGAECRDGGYCENYPREGRDRCRLHGGDSPGAPENNGHNEEHGLRSDGRKWFERHREDAEPLVRALVESYVKDAPFSFQNTAKVDQLCEVAIDQARLRHSNDHLDDFLTEQTIGTTEDGRPIKRVEENPAHMPRDRIKRTNAKILKDLGIMDDPDTAQADATRTLAEVIDS